MTIRRTRPRPDAAVAEVVDDYVTSDNRVLFIDAFVDGLNLAALGSPVPHSGSVSAAWLRAVPGERLVTMNRVQ